MTTTTALAGPVTLYQSSVGKKAVMAVTGAILFAFVVAHMLGNLKAFTGERHFDEYAEFLRTIGGPVLGHAWFLWVMRAALLVSVVLHITAATQLARQSYAARPVRYARVRTVQASYASRTMRWSGVIIGLFVVYHLLHMTTGTVHPEFEHGRVYDNAVHAFNAWYVSGVYIVAMAALALHLYHGVWSAFQTLGRNRPALDAVLHRSALAVAVAIFVGYISVPVAVMAGVIG